MNRGFRRKSIVIGILLLMLLCLCACSKAKSSRELKKYARATHGRARELEKMNSDDYSYTVLYDKTQGFTYTVTSTLRGGTFGKKEYTYDDFDERLMEYVYNSMRTEIDKLCKQYNAEFYTDDLTLIIQNPDDAEEAGEKLARILNRKNVENRLDGKVISVNDSRGKLLGTVMLPGCKFEAD